MELYRSKTHVAGIDISIERTSIGIVDVRGNILAETIIKTQEYQILNDYLNKLAEVIVELSEKTCGLDQLRSVGISAPSGNYKTGCIENSPNLPWKGIVPLATMLRERIGIAVALGNDGLAIATGEMTYGCAHGVHDFALVQIGHGVGSCIFSEGKPVNGFHGFAGEIGHTCIDYSPNARRCNCGLYGCLEEYAGERGVIATARELMNQSDRPSMLRDIPREELSPKEVTRCADAGDAMAQEVYEKVGFILGVGLANLATLLDVKIIILTGGILRAGNWLIHPAYISFNQHIFGNIRDRVKLLCSSLGDQERNILGASSLAWSVEEYSLFR